MISWLTMKPSVKKKTRRTRRWEITNLSGISWGIA